MSVPVKFDPKKTMYLIDASSFLYRSYYAMRPLHTPEGEAVQAVYGFCRMIKKLIDTFNPHYCALVWDSKGKTTRHDMYEEYKATRDAPPSDLFTQKEYITEFADAIECLQVSQDGVEADDLLYSIAQDYAKQGFTIVVVTSDKDLGQMINDNIYIYDPSKDVMYDAKKFSKKMEVPVAHLPLYFALLGDTSDNIPGVRGIGKKGAQELANQFATVEELYANLDKIEKKRARTALEQNKDKAFLSRDLFLLQYFTTGVDLNDLAFNPHNWDRALPFFQRLHFKSLVETVGNRSKSFDEKKEYWRTTYDFRLVTTAEQLDELIAELHTYKAFAIDTETDGTHPLQNELVGLSFCVKEGVAYYVPCGHKTDETQLTKEYVLSALRTILESSEYKKYLHNTKFDQEVLWAHGVDMHGIVHDTLVAASLVMKDGQRVGLKYLSIHHFNEHMITYNDVVKDFKRIDFSYVPLDDALYYAAADAHQTLKLMRVVEQQLEQEHMRTLYDTIELPITQVLYAMEREGIACDASVLADIDTKVTRDIATLEQKIQAAAGLLIPINLNSPKQVQDLLFTKLALPPQKKSSKGGYSTDASVLQALAAYHPVPALITEYRELAKLKNTYIDALPHHINPKTGRIHTSYNQVAVATGRLSSVEPNLQNIPLDGKASIRAAFKPKPGYMFVSADYSQIELRVLAYLSQDATLMDAFAHKRDIHRQTASRIFNVAPENVTSEQRQVGKRINFSVLYGMTPYGLSQDLNIPFGEAKQYIDRYFEQYPGVLAWMESVVTFAQTHDYVQTHGGRRRYVPLIHEKNKTLFQEGRRIAINTVAQGTAAELMKMGMIRLHTAFGERAQGEHILLQIHDEVLVSVPERTVEQVQPILQQALENVVAWNVPLEVSLRTGNNWQEVSK